MNVLQTRHTLLVSSHCSMHLVWKTWLSLQGRAHTFSPTSNSHKQIAQVLETLFHFLTFRVLSLAEYRGLICSPKLWICHFTFNFNPSKIMQALFPLSKIPLSLKTVLWLISPAQLFHHRSVRAPDALHRLHRLPTCYTSRSFEHNSLYT